MKINLEHTISVNSDQYLGNRSQNAIVVTLHNLYYAGALVLCPCSILSSSSR